MQLSRSALFVVAAAAMALPARSVAVSGQAPQGGPGPILGIVEVPRLFELDAEGQRTPPKSPVLLRARPTPDSAVVAAIPSAEAVETHEYGYEEAGALVYERERGWNLVRTTANVTGWLAPEDAGPFHSTETLLEDGLTYLTDAWDGFVRTAPAAGDPIRVPGDPRRQVAGYVMAEEQRMRVVLQPDGDPEAIKREFGATGMRSSPGPDGTRILDLEVGARVPLFEQPDPHMELGTNVETNRSGSVLETTGQTPQQVLVFDSRPGWYQVALKSDDWRNAQRVWLQAAPLWRYHAAADDAEVQRLALRAWGPEDWSVKVVGFRTVEGVLWVNVEVLAESDCVSASEPTVKARGWVRAHATNGAPNVWFYSRGC
jgi:hypothetical protein